MCTFKRHFIEGIDQVFHLPLALGSKMEFDRLVGLRRDVKKLGVFIEIAVDFVEDELVDDEPFGPSLTGLFVLVDDVHDGFLIGDSYPGDFFEILLFGDIDDFVGAVFVEDEELVEVGAVELDRDLKLWSR